MDKIQRNYAVTITGPRKYVFFDGEKLPPIVLVEPAAWATWHQTVEDRAHRIGEPSGHHCARNGHRPRDPQCPRCGPIAKGGQEN